MSGVNLHNERKEAYRPIPEIVINPELCVELAQSAERIIRRLVRWDTESARFIPANDVPDVIISPLRSGPIAMSGLRELASQEHLPIPPVVDTISIGNETKFKFGEYLSRVYPELDKDGNDLLKDELWNEGSEYKEFFKEWLENECETNPYLAKLLGSLRESLKKEVLASEDQLKILLVDDTQFSGVTRDFILPTLMTKALAERAYELDVEVIFSAANSEWVNQIIIDTFGDKDENTAEFNFLKALIKGGVDNWEMVGLETKSEDADLVEGCKEYGMAWQGMLDGAHERQSDYTGIESILNTYLSEELAQLKDRVVRKIKDIVLAQKDKLVLELKNGSHTPA